MFSFCNFAAGFSIGEEHRQAAFELLRENAGGCFGFYVFVMTGDEPSDLGEFLVGAGFERRHSLVGMHADVPGAAPDVRAELVVEHGERRDVAGFMAQQFFWRLPREGREAIALATAASPHTIWSVGPPSAPEAAVMLVEDPQTVGLFNLCVRPELRGKGVGSGLVRSVQAAAAKRGKPVVLQCEPDLARWYKGLGFESVGTVEAFTLSQEDGDDIIA